MREQARVPREFATLAHALPQLVWIADQDGKLVFFNQRLTEYTGLDVSDVGTGEETAAIHPDDLEQAQQRWDEAIRTATPFEAECRLRNIHDHSYRWFLASAVPIRDDAGRVERWVGTATDIDSEKRDNDNLRFMLEATAQFTSPMSEQQIAQHLADLAVKRHADWSIVYLGDAEHLEAVAFAHRDPSLVTHVERYGCSALPGIGDDLAHAVRENRTLLYAAMRPESDVPRHLSMNSAMVVPLSANDAPATGVAVFASSWWRYRQTDLEIARSVTHRAALALANARLIESERRTSELLRFVARAGELLFEDFDVTASFERLCHFAVRDIADVALVMQRIDGRGKHVLCASGKTLDLDFHMGALAGERPTRPEFEARFLKRLREGVPYLTRTFDANTITKTFWEYVAPHIRALNLESAVTIPIALHGSVHGAIVLATCGLAPPFTDSDLSAFGELGRTATIAIAQGESFSRERRIATALQRTMLPRDERLPLTDGLRFHAVYRPSSDDADIGGDWYDAVAMPDGSIVVTVGDVTGRGLDAAGLMGQLRQTFNVVALYEADPARMLDAVDELLRRQGSTALATAFVAVIDHERRTVRYANAGHPYALLKRADALIELRAFGLPLGLRDRGLSDRTQLMTLDDAQMLIFYTDGLTESTHNLLEGERRLHRVLQSDAVRFVSNPAEFIVSACVGAYAPDDTAVLTASFSSSHSWSFDAENAQAAQEARGEFIATLRSQARSGDLTAAELIFGELIGNVVRHAPGPIEIQLEWSGEHPVLHVTDRGTGFDRTPSLPEDILKESGRGLYIIETLSKSLNIEYVPGYGTHAAVALPVSR